MPYLTDFEFTTILNIKDKVKCMQRSDETTAEYACNMKFQSKEEFVKNLKLMIDLVERE